MAEKKPTTTTSTGPQQQITANRQALVRFMNDMIAGWRMGMENYENAVDRISDSEVRMHLGEFKAEVAHDFEVLRSLIRNFGGQPNPAKNLVAGVGARIQNMVTGAAGAGEGYSSALVLGQLAAGELTGNLQLRVLRDAGERMNEASLRDFAEKALRAGEDRQRWLEERAVRLAERAILENGGAAGGNP